MFGSSPVARGAGALAIIKSMSVNFNLENPDAGFYESKSQTHGAGVPKIIEIALDFTIIHEKNVGHDGWNGGITRGIYGVDLGNHTLRLAPPVPQNLITNDEVLPEPPPPEEEEELDEPPPNRGDEASEEAENAGNQAAATEAVVATTPAVEQEGQPGTDALAEAIEEDTYVPTPGLDVILDGLPEDLADAFRNADRDGTSVRLKTATAQVRDLDFQDLPDDMNGEGAYGDKAQSYDINISPQELVDMYANPETPVGEVLSYQSGTTIGTGAAWTGIRVLDTRDKATGSRTLSSGEVVPGYYIENGDVEPQWKDVISPMTSEGMTFTDFQHHTGTGTFEIYRDIVGAYSTSMAGSGVYEIVQ